MMNEAKVHDVRQWNGVFLHDTERGVAMECGWLLGCEHSFHLDVCKCPLQIATTQC